jgi:hypothetical protein
MAEFTRDIGSQASTSKARMGDARGLRIRTETIDLVFTSPPYATALDYPRAHFLAIPWMRGVLNVGFDEYLSRAPAYIGSERGRYQGDFKLCPKLKRYEAAHSVLDRLAESSPKQAKLTQRYFLDMQKVFTRVARVLKDGGHAIVVVCPSHIRKVEVPTHKVFFQMGRELGLVRRQLYTRTINERRRILPYMLEAFGKRMDTEYVLVLQKTPQG